MRIAVIGASGLLGRHTIQAAKAAGQAVAIGRSAKALEPVADAGFETRRGDLRDASSLDRQARDFAKRVLPVVIGIPTMSFGEFDLGRTTGRFILEMANRRLPFAGRSAGSSPRDLSRRANHASTPFDGNTEI
jgi:NADPH:quinone reductase-like Zn-dependent oxidoreductase